MKRMGSCLQSAALSLIALSIWSHAASAYHFEVVSVDGTLTVQSNFYGPEVSEDFALGYLSVDQIDADGDRAAQSNLLVDGNTCQFEASSIVNMNTTFYAIQSLAIVRAQFFLRVVADPGDPPFAYLTAVWSSSSYSESHDQSSEVLCHSIGYVGSVIRKNELTALDMSVGQGGGTFGGTEDLGMVVDGTIISVGEFGSLGEFRPAAISSSAIAIDMDCVATASASHSLTLMVSGSTVATEPSSWGKIKKNDR